MARTRIAERLLAKGRPDVVEDGYAEWWGVESPHYAADGGGEFGGDENVDEFGYCGNDELRWSGEDGARIECFPCGRTWAAPKPDVAEQLRELIAAGVAEEAAA